MENKSFTPLFSKNDVIKIIRFFLKKEKAGFTLTEVLVGTFLISIVFLGIFGAFQLGLKVVGLSKTRIDATALANQWIEIIRNLPYDQVGTKGVSLPYVVGILDSSTTTVRNNIKYIVEIQVQYIMDSADGIYGADTCNWDYKRAEVKVSWSGQFGGEVKLVTDVAPKNKVEEINTCTVQPGGILSVTVFDAYGKWEDWRGAPLIKIFNPETGEEITSYSPLTGKYDFPLTTSTYKVVISKDGYSSERTYGIDEVATPKKPHPIISENQLIETSFSIDRISSFSVDTLSPWGVDNFSDSFLNETKISEKSDVVVSSGQVNLATTTEGYLSSGYLISTSISPESLISWDEFSSSSSEPANTDLKYQIYYASGTDWLLIPDSDLPGNVTGFDNSLVNLSNLSTTTYSQLKIGGNFSTNAADTTPTLYDWQISWITSAATPIPNTTFNLQGAKIIGTDAEENLISKYSTTSTSNSSGHIDIPNLEWDYYTFSVSGTSLDLINTDPSPQPILLPPDTSLSVKLYLQAENSLLVTVKDTETLDPMPAASVRLFDTGLGYDTTQYTNANGQTYFIPLTAANYNLEIQAPGYSMESTTVSVSGDKTKIIKIGEVE
jgi:hypothetical protein